MTLTRAELVEALNVRDRVIRELTDERDMLARLVAAHVEIAEVALTDERPRSVDDGGPLWQARCVLCGGTFPLNLMHRRAVDPLTFGCSGCVPESERFEYDRPRLVDRDGGRRGD